MEDDEDLLSREELLRRFGEALLADTADPLMREKIRMILEGRGVDH